HSITSAKYPKISSGDQLRLDAKTRLINSDLSRAQFFDNCSRSLFTRSAFAQFGDDSIELGNHFVSRDRIVDQLESRFRDQVRSLLAQLAHGLNQDRKNLAHFAATTAREKSD